MKMVGAPRPSHSAWTSSNASRLKRHSVCSSIQPTTRRSSTEVTGQLSRMGAQLDGVAWWRSLIEPTGVVVRISHSVCESSTRLCSIRGSGTDSKHRLNQYIRAEQPSFR